MAGVLYVWVTSLEDTEYYVTTLNFQGYVEVDSEEGLVYLTLEHRGGDPVTWSDYTVGLDGAGMQGTPRSEITGASDTQSTVGESVYWTYNDHSGSFEVGGTYTVKIIEIEPQDIVWEKNIVARTYTG